MSLIDKLRSLLRRLRRPVLRPAPATALVLMLVLTMPAAAQVTGTSYTLSPLGARIDWSDKAGLSTDFLYGGELGLGFGEYLELSGLYLFGTDFETRPGDLPASVFTETVLDTDAARAALDALEARTVEVRRYGGKLRLNVGGSSLKPFLTAGTGVLRIDPEDLDASEHIYLNVGAGLAFTLAERYAVSVAAENLAYRYTPSALFSDDDLAAAGLGRESFAQQTIYNPALSASVKFYLGGRAASGLTDIDRALMRQFRGGGFRLAVEPFYGQINFHDDLGGLFPESQNVAGVQAGFDFGPQIGVRGFYWRAVGDVSGLETDFSNAFEDQAFYGGELHLRFVEMGGSFTPFVSVGGGYMNIDEGAFETENAVVPEDQYFALGGVGLEVPLSSALRLHGSARALLTSTQNVDDVSSPDNLYTNWMYAGGLAFNLGGSGRTVGSVFSRELEASRAETRTQQEVMAVELSRIRAELDSLKAVPPMMMPPASLAETSPAETAADTSAAASASTPAMARTMNVPVPEVGEIYIRFGTPAGNAVETVFRPMQASTTRPTPTSEPIPLDVDTVAVGGLSEAQIRRIVQEAMGQQAPAAGLTAEELDASLRRLEVRLEDRLRRETNLLRDDLDRRPQETTVVVRDGEGGDSTQRPRSGMVETFRTRELVGAQPLLGVRLGEGPEQFLVGVRGDYRFPGRTVRFMPELALAFGDGTALSAFANLGLPFGGRYATRVQPYVGTGLGFVTDSGLGGLDLAFNLFAGAEYTLTNGMTFFGEYSTLDFFDFNRVLAGYRVTF